MAVYKHTSAMTVEELAANRFYRDRFGEDPPEPILRCLVDYSLQVGHLNRQAGMDEMESRMRNRPGDGDMGG